MKYIVPLIVIGIISLASVSFLSHTHDTDETASLRVVATFYPLGEFASLVGREHIALTVLTPTGADAHDFEPSPKAVLSAHEADVFLFQGSGFDPWAERIAQELSEKGVTVVSMTSFFNLSESDPHIWLNPVLVMKQIEIIQSAFSMADPEHAPIYEHNTREYREDLRDLDRVYREHLQTCTTRLFITSHGAFRYLASQYGLEMIPISASSEQEPSPRDIGDIISLAREENVQSVFYETPSRSVAAETIADEIGADLFPLHSIEGLTDQEALEGKTYISLMEENMHSLVQGLSCSRS